MKSELGGRNGLSVQMIEETKTDVFRRADDEIPSTTYTYFTFVYKAS